MKFFNFFIEEVWESYRIYVAIEEKKRKEEKEIGLKLREEEGWKILVK